MLLMLLCRLLPRMTNPVSFALTAFDASVPLMPLRPNDHDDDDDDAMYTSRNKVHGWEHQALCTGRWRAVNMVLCPF
jgi:hypothetical protein